MARLRVATGRSAGKVVDVEKNAVIGRGETAELQIADLKASREHCRVFDQGGTWAVADLNSRNGIKVNGVVTTRKNLAHHDKIEIGDTVVVFEISKTAETGDLSQVKTGAAETGDMPPVKAPAKPGTAPAKPGTAPAKPGATPAKAAAAPVSKAAAAPKTAPAAPAKGPSAASSAKAAAMASARADSAKAKSAERSKAAATPAASKSGGATGEGVEVSDRVLQYQKVDVKKATVMDVDLTQSPGMTKFLIVLGCAAFLGVLVWIFSTLVSE